jgi:hypothetical protein
MRRPERAAAVAMALGVALAACGRSPRQLDPVPAELAPRVSVAEAAADDLRTTLSTRLARAIGESGPEGGIDVCSREARALTAEVSKRHQVEIGRTSTRLRNPANAARPWLTGYLEQTSGKKAADVSPAVFDLDNRLGVVQPLATLPLCTSCHGPAENLSAPIKAVLERSYPEDRATGFAVGDLRGVLWVEVEKSGGGASRPQ